MDQSPHGIPRDDASRLRRLVLIILAFGIVGAGFELVLLDHMEDTWQWVPIVLLAAGLPASIWLMFSPGIAILLAYRVLMGLFILSGFAGQWLHYQGNVEFELEMYPTRDGLELFWEALRGAYPSLAPGTMILLGLLGFVACLRHPVLRSRSMSPDNLEES